MGAAAATSSPDGAVGQSTKRQCWAPFLKEIYEQVRREEVDIAGPRAGRRVRRRIMDSNATGEVGHPTTGSPEAVDALDAMDDDLRDFLLVPLPVLPSFSHRHPPCSS